MLTATNRRLIQPIRTSFYSEWQEGNLVRYDRKNGEIVYIQPQPAAGEAGERFNWDAPILISAHDPARAVTTPASGYGAPTTAATAGGRSVVT